MIWKQVTFSEAANYCCGRKLLSNEASDEYDVPSGARGDATKIVFTDGSVLACASDWSGPWSEVTPDIDGNDPVFWIGTPIED